MNERVLHFRVGLVMATAMLLTGILVFLFAERLPFLHETYTLQLEFSKAPGVTVDTPIRRDGILIGRVSAIKLLEPRGVLVLAEIDAGRTLTKGQAAVVNSQFPLGNAVIEFITVNSADQAPLKHGDCLTGRTTENPLSALADMQNDVEQAVAAISLAAKDASQLMQSMNQVVATNSGQFTSVLEKSSAALDQFQRTASNVDRLAGNFERVAASIDDAAHNFSTASQHVSDVLGDTELRSNLEKTLAQMPLLLEESRETVAAARGVVTTVEKTFASVEQTFVGFQETNQKLNRSLDHVEDMTVQLSGNAPKVMEHVDDVLTDVQELLNELTTFSKSLNESDGTLGRFIHDPELYVRLNQAVANVECATGRLCPILDDARVAADKIARDPGGTVGVRGIIDRSPGGLKKVRPAGW